VASLAGPAIPGKRLRSAASQYSAFAGVLPHSLRNTWRTGFRRPASPRRLRGAARFRTRVHGIEEVVLRACREHLTLQFLVGKEGEERIVRLAIRCAGID
jgi:hypothetical protein